MNQSTVTEGMTVPEIRQLLKEGTQFVWVNGATMKVTQIHKDTVTADSMVSGNGTIVTVAISGIREILPTETPTTTRKRSREAQGGAQEAPKARKRTRTLPDPETPSERTRKRTRAVAQKDSPGGDPEPQQPTQPTTRTRLRP